MSERDYYEILGVSRNASSDDLKSAFRRLARQYHPDVNKEADAEERFKEINEAYAILSDADKRAAYDRFGHAGVRGQAGAALPEISLTSRISLVTSVICLTLAALVLGAVRLAAATRHGAAPIYSIASI